MSGVAGRAGPDQDRAAAEAPDMTVRVTGKVHRQLLTLQYRRKMAGESISFSDIIEQLLNQAGAA